MKLNRSRKSLHSGVKDLLCFRVVFVRQEFRSEVEYEFVILGIETDSGLVVVQSVSEASLPLVNVAQKVFRLGCALDRKSALRRILSTLHVLEALKSNHCQVVERIIRARISCRRLLEVFGCLLIKTIGCEHSSLLLVLSAGLKLAECSVQKRDGPIGLVVPQPNDGKRV